MRLCDLSPAHIRAISPYQPGKPIAELAREMGLAESSIVKLASNENPLGFGDKARAAMAAALDDLARYPDGNGFELKQALCRRYGVAMDEIVLGNGSNDVLELAARAFLGPQTSAIYAQHAFAVYPLATQAVGARGVEVPARHFGHDLDAMLAAITPDTRVLFIANPNNPTGTFVPGPELEAFLVRVPDHVLVVLDEAYTEYLGEEQRYDAIAWLARFPNLLVCRTFSKAYGLAGLRVGYGLGHPAVIDLLNRVRQPFNVGSVALAAAAAALFDSDFLARSYEVNRAGMAQLTAGFARLGLEWIPSAGNFVTFRAGDGAGVNRRLLRQGVIVRPIAGYGMPEWLRVSIGLEAENARFLEALPQALG
ncbi:MAG TPA: histidinol-phosphate transaminase [Rhodocyclaceae bacterium]|uniref:histidinol-phosphate transaminase n=1 Tax=Zoogloea sp. TaxID=49181 RepID=UPI002CC7A973|nr:histidinol-phosphate transaminase [Zoogloea sp.]HMV16608.1 histidinol-phosphate transaminase [Rhodocyclaceae bacterium]HMV64041.1 histidinol-phosphate transaminase [Rhodocyclaceae bacterium]HMW52749.1 histidinol-phosphate transaminase [Rhodocyclaceae bacterium]HMY48665.1 histidinol-phosphate transaminase [Rhodocyclaceae bacterium]HMZ75507.1 histidinol-phosphate transaminase [Rhodocyclaceae bacterium]